MTILYWPTSTGKRIMYVLAVSTATDLMYELFKYVTSSNKHEADQTDGDPDEQVAETLFFSERCSECKNHVNDNTPCGLPTCPFINLNKIIGHLSSAKKTLDICVYFLTFNSVSRALIEAHRRNVIVRVITDEESSENGASQAFNLRRQGLRVRSKKFPWIMHHKFAIIDGKVLINGSANWTSQAFFGNYENVIVTSQRPIVEGFSREFEALWPIMGNQTVANPQ